MTSLSRTASWVIVERASGNAVLETYSAAAVARLNTDRYRAVPILEYLQALNAKIRKETSV